MRDRARPRARIIERTGALGAKKIEGFLREKLYKIPGIRHTRSSFALRSLKMRSSVQI